MKKEACIKWRSSYVKIKKVKTIKVIKIISAYLLLISAFPVYAQTAIKNIYPLTNQLNVPLEMEIQITLNKSVSNYTFDVSRIFSIMGTNSGVITGISFIDDINNQIKFKPNHKLFPGEIIYAGFGPLFDKNGDTTKAFHWQFTTEVPHKTEAQFDTLKKVNILTNGGFLIDVDKDGRLDILTRDATVYYNFGNYKFRISRLKKDDGTDINSIGYIIDFNRDGIHDIVNKDDYYSKTINILLGLDDSTFQLNQKINPINLNYGGTVFGVGDINGDNYDDLIFGEYKMADTTLILRAYINDTKGNLNYSHDILNIKCSIYGTALADINKDGWLDLIFHVGDYYSRFVSVLIYTNNGYNQFQLIKEISSGGHTPRTGIFIQDYNGDGYLDIGIERDQGKTYYYNKESFYSNNLYSFWGPPEIPDEANHGDFNGDGLYDMFISHIQIAPEEGDNSPIGQSIWVSDSNRFISVSNSFVALTKDYNFCCKPIIGDIDNDGDVDAINCGYPTYIAINTINTVDIKEESKMVPSEFVLYQNYPNPFNSNTIIKYQIPFSGIVNVSIFNIVGEKVKDILNEFQNTGIHEINLSMCGISSGIYLCKVSHNRYFKILKITYIK